MYCSLPVQVDSTCTTLVIQGKHTIYTVGPIVVGDRQLYLSSPGGHTLLASVVIGDRHSIP